MANVYEPLEPLIQQAERENKWLRSYYQGLQFEPSALRAANLDGRFRWGPVNWELIEPLKTETNSVQSGRERLGE